MGASAAGKPAQAPETMISLKDFAYRAAAQPLVANYHLVPDQFAAAMGGISDLYKARLFKRGREGQTVETNHAFASKDVPVEDVVQVIHNCTGVSRKVSARVLAALELTLQSYFVGREGVPLALRCLGVFRPIRLQESSYKLDLHDPSAG